MTRESNLKSEHFDSAFGRAAGAAKTIILAMIMILLLILEFVIAYSSISSLFIRLH